jgi:arginyl-tRNA synthetase
MSETGKNFLEQLIKQSIAELGLTAPKFEVFRPDFNFGDFSTNVALVLAKTAKQNPMQLAEQIIEKLKSFDTQHNFIITPKGGFINFALTLKPLMENLQSVLDRQATFGQNNVGQGKKVLVEYFQPNIAKPLHLGHIENAIVGDSLFKFFQFCGFQTESDTHLGDWGTQFGLLLLAFKKYGDINIIETNPITELNKLYVKINAEAEVDTNIRELGKAEFVKLEQGDEENRALWKKFKAYSWQEFEFVYSDLGIRRADHDWPESFFEDKMPQVLEKLKQAGLLVESQGAQIVNLEAHNLGIALLVKSDGGTTYLLRDLATLIFRKQQGFTKQYYVVDVRQSHTLKQTFKIIELLGDIAPAEAVHVAYGFLTLPEGAMSTRKGTIVNANEFVAGVKAEAQTIIQAKNPNLPQQDQVAKQVAVGAIKYFILSHNIKSDIVFDPKTAITFEGNTGPYLQYTHARIHGVLRKGSTQSITVLDPAYLPKILSEYELTVLRKLEQFPEIVERSAGELLPNLTANYLFELAQMLNSFYQNVSILQEPDVPLKTFRLSLISATAQVLKNGLNLLGIEAPEEM